MVRPSAALAGDRATLAGRWSRGGDPGSAGSSPAELSCPAAPEDWSCSVRLRLDQTPLSEALSPLRAGRLPGQACLGGEVSSVLRLQLPERAWQPESLQIEGARGKGAVLWKPTPAGASTGSHRTRTASLSSEERAALLDSFGGVAPTVSHAIMAAEDAQFMEHLAISARCGAGRERRR